MDHTNLIRNQNQILKLLSSQILRWQCRVIEQLWENYSETKWWHIACLHQSNQQQNEHKSNLLGVWRSILNMKTQTSICSKLLQKYDATLMWQWSRISQCMTKPFKINKSLTNITKAAHFLFSLIQCINSLHSWQQNAWEVQHLS